MTKETNKEKRIRRHKRVRSRIAGSAERPRLVMFRSNKHLYAQLIDDNTRETLASTSDFGVKKKIKGVAMSKELGKIMAGKAKEKNIVKIVFDRGGYKYHGNIKAFAEGAREEGLVF